MVLELASALPLRCAETRLQQKNIQDVCQRFGMLCDRRLQTLRLAAEDSEVAARFCKAQARTAAAGLPGPASGFMSSSLMITDETVDPRSRSSQLQRGFLF